MSRPSMNSAVGWVLLMAVAVVCVCCSSEVPADFTSGPSSGFRTSQLHFDARRLSDGFEIVIPYTYRNATGDSVYFINCNGIIVPALEKRTGEQWVSVWSGATPACLSSPVVVPPTGEFVDTVRVLAGPNIYPDLRVDEIDGTYRLVWHGVVHSYDTTAPQFGTVLPPAERTSNEFTLGPPQ